MKAYEAVAPVRSGGQKEADMNEFDAVREDLLQITKYEVLGKLPDPFLAEAGVRLTSSAEWAARRAELYRTVIELQYGTQPPKPDFLTVERLCDDPREGTFLIHTGTRERPVQLRMRILLPGTDEKCPVIVDGDACWRYHLDRDYLDAALEKGIGWVLFDRTELAHDNRAEGRVGALYDAYPDCTFGALGAWAWGYMRCVDALETLDLPVDMDWIAFSGHSRGGKTAALAGALDTRARIVNPNETCAGACGCYRVHMSGHCGDEPDRRSETLEDLWGRFAFWMGPAMGDYAGREAELPFDAHELKAMIAPRILLVSEAAGDLWGNPVGSWQTTMAAREVFRFLGAEQNLLWYFRPGRHAHAVADVAMLAGVVRHKRNGEPLDPRMFLLPFKAPEFAFDWRCPGADPLP